MGRVRVKPVAERSAEERAADAARLAEMFAARQPPGTRGTDRAFLQDRHNGKQFEKEPAVGDRYASAARRAGVSTAGRVYHSGLARFPGDPAAWISDTGDLRKRCETMGKSCTGIIEYQAPQQPPPPSKALGEDIVQRLMTETILADPDTAVRLNNGKQTMRDLRDEVIEKHSFKRKPTKKKVLTDVH